MSPSELFKPKIRLKVSQPEKAVNTKRKSMLKLGNGIKVEVEMLGINSYRYNENSG